MTKTLKKSKSNDSNDSNDSTLTEYSMVSHLNHITLAPDTYVGSTEKEKVEKYIYCEETGRIILKLIEIVPAFYKIFDEVLVNAIDHFQRLNSYLKQGKKVEHVVTEIRVNFNKETGVIKVYNDGNGIDLLFLEEHQMYPPTLIFGNLLTGSNFDKSIDKTWGGKNGYGAKLANIFSIIFNVDTVDALRKLHFSQSWSDNMKTKTEPELKPCQDKPYTCISFIPDFKKFGLEGLDNDHLQLFKRRVYDIAAWAGNKVKVYLDDTLITHNTFPAYAELYLGNNTEYPKVCQRINHNWEIIATYSEDDTFQHVSMVNAINTSRGGKHVEYIADQIKQKLVEIIKKKKKITVKPSTVKNQLFVFVRATIVNPYFDSQTKETLTTPKAKFGSNASIDQKFIEKLYNSPITDKIILESEYKSQKDVKKTDGKKVHKIVGMPKLSDANRAGGKYGKDCTLILTEGDSAKTTAVSGLSVVGRDYYGIYPFKR